MNKRHGGQGSPPLAWITPLAAAFFLIVGDQVTKYIIESSLALNESVVVIPGLFNIVHVKNRGAAFGLMADMESEWVSIGFTVVAVIAVAVIIALYRSLRPGEIITKVSLTLIGSGAIGNLIDRIRLGSVTDFLLFYIGEYQWPAFNVADSCITVGVIMLGYTIILGSPKEATGDGAENAGE